MKTQIELTDKEIKKLFKMIGYEEDRKAISWAIKTLIRIL